MKIFLFSLKIAVPLIYFLAVLLCGFVFGYYYKQNRYQYYYDKGVYDGKEYQLEQDEYLYHLIREKYDLGIDLEKKGV
jgi:hypothetical protein